MRGLLQHWTESSIILTSKEELVWRNKTPRNRTVSFVAGRLLTWSTNTSWSQEPMIPSRIMPTYSPLVFEMTIFRNSIRNGTEFYYQWRSSTRTVPICERSWTDIEPQDHSPIDYPVSKRLSTLVRHGELLREEDGAIEFWWLKYDLHNKFEYSQNWSDGMWKSRMAEGGDNETRFQYCTDPSGQEILYLRALQGHSGRNPIDPSSQDNVLIPNNFFECIYHMGCAISVHSITISGLIAGGQNSSRDRQTVFFTAVNPMHKNHQDRAWSDQTFFASHKKEWKSRLWILWTKNTKIRITLTWKQHVLHGKSRKSGRYIRTRCIGST